MKSLMLATVATIALGMPAMAADQMQSGTTDSQTQTQLQGSQQNAQGIAPSNLNASQIRQIQQALDQRGFDAGEADGVWGPDTRAALRDFQEQRDLSTAQTLNEETLSALGVDFASGMGSSGVSTTGSGASETTGSGLEASDMDGEPATAPSDSSQ